MRRQILSITAASLLMAFSTASPGQNQHSVTPATPELLGLYPGMPMRAAQVQLQQHSKRFPVTTTPDNSQIGMTITDSSNRDMITVFLTREPNDPAVWMVQRAQNFNASEAMSISALLSALHEKYGKETLTMDRGGGGLYLFWIYDANGKLRSSAEQSLTGCSGSSFLQYIANGPPQTPNSIEQTCFRSFYAITAMLNRHDAQMLEAYMVELVNIPYALNAATVTLHAKNAAAEKARQDLVNKGDQKKPSF